METSCFSIESISKAKEVIIRLRLFLAVRCLILILYRKQPHVPCGDAWSGVYKRRVTSVILKLLNYIHIVFQRVVNLPHPFSSERLSFTEMQTFTQPIYPSQPRPPADFRRKVTVCAPLPPKEKI